MRWLPPLLLPSALLLLAALPGATDRPALFEARAPRGIVASSSRPASEVGAEIPRATLAGYRAAGVPGTVAGLALALRKYGSLPWRRVVEPARKLAAEGIPVTPAFARSFAAAAPLLSPFPESRRIFLRDGRAYD